MKRGLALVLSVLVSGVLVSGVLVRASGPTSPAVTGTVRLKAITSRTHSGGASLTIEATEPVGYVVTRPDPLTLMIDFRNVAAGGVAPTSDAKSPIAGVAVENGEVLGAPSSRVRVILSEPVAHHVRSNRNTVVVDFDKPTGKPYILPIATPVEPQAPGLSASPAIDPIAALGLNAPVVASTPAPAAVSSAPLPLSAAAGTRQVARQAAQAGQFVQGALGQGAQAAQGAPAGQGAAPAPAAGTAAQGAQGDTAVAIQADQPARRFSGNPISLDFQGADLRAVLRTFAEVSSLNVVIDPQVQGTVDVTLRDVPWDQALDIILRANKLGYVVDGTIVRIAPVVVLAAEQKERSDLAKAQADAGQLATLTRQLSYARGEEIVALLKAANVLSVRGTTSVDARTNTLIITDLQDRLTGAADLVTTLDKPQPQVEIEARIVQTNRNYARSLGVQWGFNGNVSPQLGNTTNLAFPNSGSLGGRVGSTTQGPSDGSGTKTSTAVNLGAAAATSALGLQLGSVNGAFNLDVALSALETSGNGRILSTPKVSTLNNVAAEMTQGVQIPIQTVANNTISVQFKDAALKLQVTPQITAANTVIMQIALENATPDFSRAVNNIPPINTQRANTAVLVSDGQTTVIGGIYTSRTDNSTDSTPGLSRVPILGWLFKREATTDQNTELLIFITPRIIKL